MQKGVTSIVLITILALIVLGFHNVIGDRQNSNSAPLPQINTVQQTVTPTPTPFLPDFIDETKIMEAKEIKEAVARKSEVSLNKLVFHFDKISEKYQGRFASGSCSEEGFVGGGHCLVVKINGTHWISTSIGNGIPPCSKIEPFRYPSEMAPVCIDPEKGMVNR